jgi:hypothetical protein
MKRQVLALIVVLAVFVVLAAPFLLRPNPQRNALRARELATHVMAEQIARLQPGQRVLVVSNPFTKRAGVARAIIETEEAGIRGLREGFGKNVMIGAVAFPELKPEAWENPRSLITDPATPTPLSYLVTPGAFDRLAQEHPDCNIIVSLVGLPAELAQCEIWQTIDAHKFALLFPDVRILGGNSAVQNAVKSGKLLAFVLRKPGSVDDQQPLRKELGLEFERRFLLVTAENIDQLLKKHPAAF